VSATAQSAAIEGSREAILDEIGDPPDLVFVRGLGHRGDELIWEGTRELLGGRIYRDIELEALCSASGHTVLLSGGGAACRPYHEWLPRALAIAELRFERVILLPSSFDPSEDVVREALTRTAATVFAREAESYRRIRSLCDARLAHDCAFFFDFSPYRREGEGVLNAFRTDAEARAERGPLPEGNDDITVSSTTLEAWLEKIAAHELVRTDRAHVMIAAAMMGKRVEYLPSSYHKLDALAHYALSDLPVRRLEQLAHPVSVEMPRMQRATSTNGARSSRPSADAARIAAVILTRDRTERAVRAIDSLQANEASVRTLVIDNNSAPAAAAELVSACAARDRVDVERSDRNLGCAGGRAHAVERTDSEFVLFLDDDAELEPGALDVLTAELDADPDAAAVSATAILPDGRVHHSGGWMRVSRPAVEFGLIGAGRLAEELEPSGAADWVPGTAALIRRDALERFPIDPRMRAYCEDNEWCYRVQRARPGSFRRSARARALHHLVPKPVYGTDFRSRSAAAERLETYAAFYALHAKLLIVDLFELVPELRAGGQLSGDEELIAAKLLMELLVAKGADWVLMEWMNGQLDTLLSAPGKLARTRAEVEQLRAALAQAHEAIAAAHAHVAGQREELAKLRISHETLVRIEQGGWWRLREAVLPALRLCRTIRRRGG
jgi:exopolysaccharide biosynthesis predicted pyruvyltransferase EpsI/glycosyltransferase involved in cell wall biosynthesis